MNASKRRLTGIGMLVGAILVTVSWQIFGNGLVVATQLPSSTINNGVVNGVNLAGGQVVNLNRVIVLGVIGLTGLLIAVVPYRSKKRVT